MSSLIDEYTKNKSPEDKKEVERRVREMSGNMSELSALLLVLEEMTQEKANGGIMRLGFQEGTPDRKLYETSVTDAIKSVNEKTQDLIMEGTEAFDKYSGIDQITGSNFPGAYDEASGQPSDFRHQAASNLLAEALGKGSYTDSILGPISYVSGGIGATGLGAIKEVGDLVSSLVESPKEYKDAFSEFLKDNLSNIKGAFAKPGTTSEELYEKLMVGYVPKRGTLRMVPIDTTAQIFMQRKKAREDALKKLQKDFMEQKNIITPLKKPTKTTSVTGTTKPGTSGGGGSFTPTTTAQNVARTTSRVEDGKVKAYGLAKGGLAAMLGE